MESSTAARGRDVVGIGLMALAALHVALGLLAAVAPGTFFDEVGPFGVRNDHYVRDAVAAFQGSLGVAMAIAVVRREWRVGVLGYAVLQYAFHSVNHLVDVGEAEPERYGPLDLAGVAGGTVLIAWLLARAVRDAREAAP
ncbi:MAG TPA: hypothetical protein VF520_03720 [Thermoleophilaceae bacterium]|jgi:hypothetical protein